MKPAVPVMKTLLPTRRPFPVNRRSGRVLGEPVPVLREEEPAPVALDPQRRQRPAAERADVDADAVALLVGLCRDAVAVDDHLAMIGRIIEELLANPAQVGQRLLVERHAGPDAGMNEDIVAD